jgi:hypothetical protein
MADRLVNGLVRYKASVIGNVKKPVQCSFSLLNMVSMLEGSLPLVYHSLFVSSHLRKVKVVSLSSGVHADGEFQTVQRPES